MTSIIVRSRSRKVLLAVRQLLERRARFRTGDAALRPSVTARRFTSSATPAAATDPAQRLAGRGFGSFIEAYAGHRTPPPLDTLRAWVALRHLWSLRLAAGFAESDGVNRRASFIDSWSL